MKVLIIDDDPGVTRAISRVIERRGHESFVAANGLKGCDLYFHGKPDVCIVDIMLPGLDGPSVCRKIREAEGDAGAYLILSSAVVKSPANRLRLLRDTGADGYLEKPFTARQLIEALNVGLEKKGLEPLSPGGPARPAAAPAPEKGVRASSGAGKGKAAPKVRPAGGAEEEIVIEDDEGDLVEEPLSQLLLKLNRYSETGVLTLSSGRQRHRLYLNNGWIACSAEEAPGNGRPAGGGGRPVVPASSGTVRDSGPEARSKTQQHLLACMRIASGGFKFVAAPLAPDLPNFRFHPAALVFKAALRANLAEAVFNKALSYGEMLLAPGPRYRDYRDHLAFDETARDLLSLADGAVRFNDVFGALKKSPVELVKRIWPLLELGVIELREAPSADPG